MILVYSILSYRDGDVKYFPLTIVYCINIYLYVDFIALQSYFYIADYYIVSFALSIMQLA